MATFQQLPQSSIMNLQLPVNSNLHNRTLNEAQVVHHNQIARSSSLLLEQGLTVLISRKLRHPNLESQSTAWDKNAPQYRHLLYL